MDEQRRRPDPTSRPDHSSPDLWELAVRRAEEEPGPDGGDGAPPLPRLQAGPFRVGPTGLLVGVVLLVAVGTLVRFGADRTPQLPASCTEFGLALSTERARPGGLVAYTVVGPSGGVVLQVDDAAQVLPPVTLASCRATGRFGIQVPQGDHEVVVLRDGRPVARRAITVTEPRDPTAG